MKSYRPGGATLQSADEDAATPATPGKQTLAQGYHDAVASQPAPPLAGGAGLTDGATKLEGGTLFSGPDATLRAEVPAVATPDKTSDADYEKTMGIKAAIDKKTMLPVAGVNGQRFTATGCAGKKTARSPSRSTARSSATMTTRPPARPCAASTSASRWRCRAAASTRR